jgi:hypothetical protein
MTDPRLATLEAVEADRDYWRDQAKIAASASEARRRETDHLRSLLEETRSRLITFCAMLEDDHITGGLRIYVMLRDNATNLVVNNAITLPFPPGSLALHDDWLENALAQGTDKVAREYAYALAMAQR